MPMLLRVTFLHESTHITQCSFTTQHIPWTTKENQVFNQKNGVLLWGFEKVDLFNIPGSQSCENPWGGCWIAAKGSRSL
jgi:hypothetical protein